MTIGQRIKKIRGKTPQKRFASTIGVAQNTLGNYERDERTPNADVIIAIAKTYRVSFDWLLTGEGPTELAEDFVMKELASADIIEFGSELEKSKLLETELSKERATNRELMLENRELYKENRQLWKENSLMKIEIEKLKARAAPDQDMHNEAHRKVG
ncbi:MULTISPECIES: helix-turn-helix domain-containing protein [unclassified Maridesulfovibrio]|uniref:helix-turn-helix domain-containing protein n=1 Tax=unclassified Maridesulfovibrio TaxID=2794999 RepID=UPI003B3EA129